MRVAMRTAGLVAMLAALVGGCATGNDPAEGTTADAAAKEDLAPKEDAAIELDVGDEPVAPEDTGAAIDAAADVTIDTGIDTPTDDGRTDAAPDAPRIDAPTDTGIDARTDTGFDVGFDVGFDAGTAVDTGFDAGTPIDPGGRRCPAGMFVTGVAAGGALVCSDLADAVRRYVDGSCRVHLGWQDSCNGCMGPPTKWGSAGAATCAIGGGADNSCISALVGTAPVRLFGVNPDGDVDNNDVLYAGLSCAEPPATTRTGGCPMGQFVTGIDAAGQAVCASPDGSARAAIGRDCFLYGGWRDECPACTVTPPTKWDRVNDTTCQNLVGPNGDTCTQASLGGATVRLLGLDFDGDVNNDDQIFVGMRCEASGGTQGSGAIESCPADQAAYGIGMNGALLCAPVAPAVHAYFTSSCYLYLGWLDSCGGCTRPPVKWGRVSATMCANGAGADNTCTMQTLNGTTLPMFGLNFDGDVDNNDLLNLGLHCF